MKERTNPRSLMYSVRS